MPVQKRKTGDGAQTFPSIQGPEGAEEYSWEVQLHEGQTLESVDDQNAVVRAEDGTVVFTISAVAAHDSVGTTVSTSLAVANLDEASRAAALLPGD